MTEKVVSVRMSEDLHSILKAYCSLIGKTIGEVMYDWARQELHQASLCSIPLQSMFDAHQQKLDHRANKACWGYRCNLCEHETPCRCGQTTKTFILKKQLQVFIKSCCSDDSEDEGSGDTACNTNNAKLN